MQTTIQKWGNSQAVRLPKFILESVDMKENDRVEISSNDNVIIIKKTVPGRNNNKKLVKRLEEFYKKPIDKILSDDTLYTPEEIDWGKPVGKELW